LSIENLTICLEAKFKAQGDQSILEEIFSLYSSLSNFSSTTTSLRSFKATQSWVRYAKKYNHHSSIIAFSTSLALLSRLVATEHATSYRHELLKGNAPNLAADAFSYTARRHRGELTTAIELLEQGRGILWTQLMDLRTPVEDLAASGDHGRNLAQSFVELNARLRASVEDISPSRESLATGVLMKEREALVEKIRGVPGFSRFLLPPLFSDLQRAAQNGPIIIVNASEYSCDAVIIPCSAAPIHIPLDVSKKDVVEFSSRFQSIIWDSHSSNQTREIVIMLRDLWNDIVQPIVHGLCSIVQDGSRVWWCPTAEFTSLPLHAAGPYMKGEKNFCDLYIPSYTPTLGALLRAQQTVEMNEKQPRLVAIGQAQPYKGTYLPFVAQEIDIVRKICTSHEVPYTQLVDDEAMVAQALDKVGSHEWIHLACHGYPNEEHPFSSCFAMRDGPLSVMHLLQAKLQQPEFAFLSACHTAAFNRQTPDEMIHLAAGMQFSGFRSVVGTMWAVDDEFVGRIVSTFYEEIFKAGRLDSTRVAAALNRATTRLRKVPLEQRVLFIHIGI
jgi:hypothetical protein